MRRTTRFGFCGLMALCFTGFEQGLVSGQEVEGANPPVVKKSRMASSSGGERSVADIAKATRPSLVKVTQEGREGPFGIGSGFVIESSGLIATNRHVIGEGRRIAVETSSGRALEVIEILASDAKLDLAILRVKATDLQALELGDSEAAVQGQPIVAMGNPQGLTFSVTDGVISEPKREVEGLPMIQVAVPIEQGNSGGPLLDRQGRVLGVLTLKSAVTENLGFAMPVSALRKLLEKPNPIPMERWLTFGVMNPRLWQTLMGAQWTQRAGQINVSRTGTGFGGRSLCLWNESPPGETFEASVSVRMEEESGAAGLVFCSDGDQRHYGFYPTNGKLRLTRFDGPDVLSWQILAERESEAYVGGNWNVLRVRVQKDRIQCFVNETEVFDLRDGELRGGRAGLCKFRNTQASFKRFKVGLDVSSLKISGEEEETSRRAIDGLLSGNLSKREAMQSLLGAPEASRDLLERSRKKLEEQTQQLREFAGDLHRQSIRDALVAELSKIDGEADLLRCALLLSKHDNPDLDVEAYQKNFDQMVEEVRGFFEISGTLEQAIDRMNRYLFEENGFHGSRHDYGNRSNSYLNEVLDDREGLPIALSVVYIELARRVGLREVVGIPLPGRFMVGYRSEKEEPFAILDVYDQGKKMTMEQAILSIGEQPGLSEKATQPASKRDILLRMIRNLMGALTDPRAVSRETLPYLDLIIALDPEPNRERVARAMVRERLGDRNGSIEDVRWVLEKGHGSLSEDQQEMLQRWLHRLSR